MPGLLTHLSVALAGCLIATLFFRNWKYGLAFVIGHLIPDVIRFGITGIVGEKYNFHEITAHPLFWKLSFTHYAITWIIVFAAIFAAIFGLYKFKKINKKEFKTWFFVNFLFFIGAIFHLILDALIIEKSYWT